MVETQMQQNDGMPKKDQEAPNANMAAQAAVMPQPAAPKPISQIDKLKLMIIRIGDEMRHNRDDNLQKLKTQLTNAFVLKEKIYRLNVTETLIACVHAMPHKVNLYSALLALVAVEDFDFAQDLIRQIIESLHQVLVLDGNVFASKNVFRLLGNLVQMKLIGSEAFCKFLLQLVEEFEKMNLMQDGNPGCQSHSADLMLEVILASLPSTATILAREQSIDFGTVLESLKTMLKEREKTKSHFMPLKANDDATREIGTDLLMKTWEAFTSNTSKVFCVDEVLISASRKLIVDVVNQIAGLGRQIDQLPQVYLAEFNHGPYLYSLETQAQPEFQRERLRRYRSPFILNGLITGITDKYQAVLATDIALALIHTFQDSHEMTASNLLNMYIADEYKEFLPEVLLTAVLSLVVHSEKPFHEQSVFFTILTNSLIEQSKSIESMKKFKGQIEDHLARFIFKNVTSFTQPTQRRICNYLALLLSQVAGRDLGQTEPMLLKITETNPTEDQVSFLRTVFAQLCKLCFVKKVQEQMDPKFHDYLPSNNDNAAAANQGGDVQMASADEPELQLITDAILAKQTSEQLLEIVQNGSIFVQAILNRTKKSLEHLKTSVERYKKVFDELLSGPDGQSQIIEQVVHVFKGQSSLEDRDKVEKVLAKLCQINCISNHAVIEWACNSVNTKGATVSQDDLALEFNIILQALQRESTQKWITVTQFQQKPPTLQAAEGEVDNEEGKLQGGDAPVKMENGEDGGPPTDSGAQDGGRRHNQSRQSQNQRRLTLEEYQEQFRQRLASELEVFKFAIAKLNTILDKNSHMESFMLRVFREVETSYVTTGEMQQCCLQTTELPNEQLAALVRLL